MKNEDVGPVPIVHSDGTKRLAGILTDRDLALKVVAAGRDPNAVRLEEIMSRDLVTCHPDEPVEEAMRRMSDHQVRRIPVVDDNGQLAGIIAQADIARHFDERAVGDVVEDISQPHGLRGRIFGGFRGFRSQASQPGGEYDHDTRSRGAGTSALTACLGLALGAAAMYLMDPSLGRRRRAVARDKAVRFYSDAAWAMDKTRKDVQNRASGVMHQARAMYPHESEPVPDHKLIDRVRSKMGRFVSHPHAVQVQAHDGQVTLTGDIPADELDQLLKCVRNVSGVSGVDNQMQVHHDTSNVPSLQGGRERPGWRSELTEENWTPATRLAAGVVTGGVLLAGLGLARRRSSAQSHSGSYPVS